MPSSEKRAPQTVPFELKGGSPFIYRVTLPGGEMYDLAVTPVVHEVQHVPGMINPVSPDVPVFRMQVQLTTATKKVAP